jgi:hypothetical protein
MSWKKLNLSSLYIKSLLNMSKHVNIASSNLRRLMAVLVTSAFHLYLFAIHDNHNLLDII